MIALNLTRCGELLVNSVLASRHLRHKSVQGTMVYVQPTTAEEAFVYDVLSGVRTEVLVARWFNDPQEAP